MPSDRYTRQRRLAEIGDAGQRRIEAASAVVRGLDGADVELRYLTGAGLSNVVHDSAAAPLAFAHEAFFAFPSSRRVAAGAWRALRTLKGALEERGA
jgi:hypothetical protein